MTPLMGAIVEDWDGAIRLRPRSVVAGRQRWDVGMVLSQPGVAELIVVSLRELPGMTVVQANPVTGRLLIYHDTTLSAQDVDRMVRATVELVVTEVGTPTRSIDPQPSAAPQVPVRRRRHTDWSGVLVGGAAVVAVVARRRLHSSSLPLVGLGCTVLATVLVIRRTWRNPPHSQQPSAPPIRLTEHPLLSIVGPHRLRLYLASFSSILGQILEMTPFVLSGWILVVLARGVATPLFRLGLTSVSGQLWFLCGATALASAALSTVSSITDLLWHNLALSVQHEWRTEMYAHVQRVELWHLEGERTTRLARVLTDDINQLGLFFLSSANNLVQLGTSFVVLVPVFLLFAPGIAWVALLPMPIIAWLSLSHHEHAAPEYAISSERGSLLNSQLINNLEASSTVKSFTAEEFETGRIHRLSKQYQETNRRINKRAVIYAQSARACSNLSIVGVLLLGGHAVLSGALSFHTFNLMAFLPRSMTLKLPTLGDSVDQYQQTLAALERVLALGRLPVEPYSSGRRLDAATVNGELVLDGATFGYPGRTPVFQNLSLRVASGKTTGIVGVTGAGKTTIAKLLLRLHDVESGRILLDDQDIRDLRLHDLRNLIGFVDQNAFLFDGTVEDNIRYGSFDASSQRLIDAARLAEADSFIQSFPSRYDTLVGERGVTLSGGQRQRIALARAILKDTPIIILDEATSAVDNETEATIQRALADFARDRTLIVIAHRLSTIRHADWIYVIGTGGVIAEQGTHDQLLENQGIYTSLWHLQAGETGSLPSAPA